MNTDSTANSMTNSMRKVAWSAGNWFTAPPAVAFEGEAMIVDAAPESDLWRNTSYGFVHNSAHALLIDFPNNSSVEISFILNLKGQFDQAGVLVRADDEHWTKAGIEFAEGALQIGAVVTSINSDWSTWPQDEWSGKEVTIRVSRSGDALTIRAKAIDEKGWQLVRVAPIDPSLDWKAGPHLACPLKGELQIKFTNFTQGPADTSLH